MEQAYTNKSIHRTGTERNSNKLQQIFELEAPLGHHLDISLKIKCTYFFQMPGFGTSKISPVAQTKDKSEAKTRQNQTLWGSGFRVARYPGPVVRG